MTRRRLGNLLLAFGVLVWPAGWFLLPLLGIELSSVPDLLAFHLLGVLPGAYLRGSRLLGSGPPDRLPAFDRHVVGPEGRGHPRPPR